MTMAPSPQGTRWCFTINNPTDEDKQSVADVLTAAKYGVVGRELGDFGTPHLQGFVIFESNKRFSYLHRLWPRAHLELTRGNSRNAADYCKKDGDFDEYGELPAAQGARRDLEALYQWGDEFTTTNGRPPTSPEIAKEHPTAYLRYPRVTRLFEARAAAPRFVEAAVPMQWQGELEDELLQDADDRSVLFYVDPEGGKGKTWFQKWFITKHPDLAQVLSVGKREDLAHVVDVRKSVFFFNVPRDSMQFFQYVIAEQLKDRMVFSPKYQSKMKVLAKTPHVVVFCNEDPDDTKMTADRIVIRNI